MEDGGGGSHSNPTALGLGISAPPTNPKFLSFVWDWEGAQECFILCDQTTGDIKFHHLQARAALTAMSVPPRPPFLSAELWVICYHLGIIMHYRMYSQYHNTHNILKCAKNIFLGTQCLFGEGRGGGCESGEAC